MQKLGLLSLAILLAIAPPTVASPVLEQLQRQYEAAVEAGDTERAEDIRLDIEALGGDTERAEDIAVLPSVRGMGFGTTQAVNIVDGLGVVSGEVGRGQDVFVFSANEGDYVLLDVNVTAELQGTRYQDDDSHLFLFDSNGFLVAENDDEYQGTYESLIGDVRIPATGQYYAVVTTYGNLPRYDSGGRLVGWAETGDSRIRYDLIVSLN